MHKRITFFSLLLFIMGLAVSISAQQNNSFQNLSIEPPMISGGAENSIFIEEQKKLGNKSIFYNKYNSTEAPTSIEATNAITTIEGINFNEDATNNGGIAHIPPDPSGAIGPSHLVSVTNSSIEWFSRAGTQINSQSLNSFFTSLTPLTGTFDPKVIYDQYEGRFVVVTLERTVGTPNTSNIFLAVSKTNDPTDGWYFHSINSLVSIDLGLGDGPEDFWADYPGFAIGKDEIYITNNMFSHASSINHLINTYGGTRLWIVDKGVVGGFYAGAAGSDNIYDPFSGGGLPSTLQPAHMFGTPPTGVGTYLVGRNSSGGNRVLQLFTVSSTSLITFSGYINIGTTADLSISLINAPQMGTTKTIETNDSRLYNAIWRNNLLYTASVFVPSSGSDAGQTTAHWMQVNTTTNTMVDQGNIGAEDIGAGTHTFFPSVAVNAIGEMMVGFAASGPTIYPGAYYTFRFPYDPAGTVQSSKILKAGVDFYNRVFANNGGTQNRWGDYSGSSVDPNNDITFCLFNEYALVRGNLSGGEDGRWGTVFGIMPNLDLTVLLEGPYSGGGMTTGAAQNAGIPLTQPYNVAPWNYQGQETITALPPNIADWVLVTLRKDLNASSPDPATAVYVASRAALLKSDGSIVDLNGSASLGFSVEPGDYYIVIEHRNHLAIMSPNAVTIN